VASGVGGEMVGDVFNVLGSAAQGTANVMGAAAVGIGETAVETEKVKGDESSSSSYAIC
jgi:hypothetical protein